MSAISESSSRNSGLNSHLPIDQQESSALISTVTQVFSRGLPPGETELQIVKELMSRRDLKLLGTDQTKQVEEISSQIFSVPTQSKVDLSDVLLLERLKSKVRLKPDHMSLEFNQELFMFWKNDPEGFKDLFSDVKFASFLPILNILNISDIDERPLTNEMRDLRQYISGNPLLNQLSPYIDDIENNTKPYLQPSSLKFIAFAIGVCSHLSGEQVAVLLDSELCGPIFNSKKRPASYYSILDLIYNHKFYPVRYFLLLETIQIIKNVPVYLNILPYYKNIWTKVAALAFGSFFKHAQLEQVQDILQCINVEEFKDDYHFNRVLSFMEGLVHNKFYEEERPSGLVLQKLQEILSTPALRSKQKKGEVRESRMSRIMNALIAYECVCNLVGPDAMVDSIESGKDPKALLVDRFQSIFRLTGLPAIMTKYEQSFANFRDPLSIFIFRMRLNQLPSGKTNTEIRKCFDLYVMSVLEGTFKDLRYNKLMSKHLSKIFEGAEGEEARVAWMENRPAEYLYIDKNSVEAKAGLPSRYRIIETDDPDHLINIGTDVRNSCMRIDGDPEKNRYLVSYSLNGEVKAIGVMDGDKIIARSIIRCGWDSVNQRRVVLQELMYSNTTKKPILEGICEWADAKAKKMKAPLVAVEVGEGPQYDGKVMFFEGLVSITYCDASDRVEEGAFEVSNCHVLSHFVRND